ncbi:hypothetical protein [Deinococcus budaensis]|uniref:Tetratricopeptide (TPR) repeat protein n=1 Tax=Deinococcus budaensis TaxID=1665626 RepID=A0A7W8GEK1_9DEIO|nr:hypothetical protein [Deinococcus budaensis]MBB5234176.1 tetratricopeptide (TPR) repeat protein [Deinococcus budaensis]
MDVFSVDLNTTRLFQEWYLEELEAGATPSEVVAALGEMDSTLATIRALSVAYQDRLPEYEDLSKQCLTSGDLLAAEIAKGYAVFQRSLEILRQGEPHMRVRISEMKGALTLAQRRLAALPQSDVVIEGQVGIIIPLCVLLLEERQYEDAIELASQGLFLAEQLQAPITIARARTMVICCKANAGHTVATIQMVEDDRRQSLRYDAHYADLELAAALFRLGNYEEASSIMSGLVARSEGERRERALEYRQRVEAIWGVGGLEGPTYAVATGSAPSQWLTEVTRSLMRAYGVPREGKDAEERAQHFSQVLEQCRRAEENGHPWHDWKHLFAQWAIATAHLGRGEFVDAAGVLEHAEQPNPEALDIRVLVLGSALELSLSWQAPEGFSVARYEHLLRQAFADATRIRYASPAGLARLLQRWHPTAAAYLALAPNPVLACASATRSVMKVGQHNFVDDLGIPPVYACDLTLRALDFDLRRDFAFVQGDPGASRKKKKDLLQTCGTVPVWRLPVSAVKLAYGMMRHQNPEYQGRAESVIQTYGIRPMTNALYPMIGALDDVERYTRELLDGHLTAKGFAAKMGAIRP